MSRECDSISQPNESVAKWSCKRCTYNNYPKTKRCTMCGETRSNRLIIDSLDTQDEAIDIYKMAPLIVEKGSSEEKNLVNWSNSNTSKWSCHLCTYLNYPRSSKCTQCRCPRKGSPSRSGSPSTPAIGSNDNMSNMLSSQVIRSHLDGQIPTTISTTTTNSSDICYHNDRNRMGSSLATTFGLKWSCQACTYDNWQAAKKCVICATPKRIDKTVDLQSVNSILELTDESHVKNPASSGGAQATTTNSSVKYLDSHSYIEEHHNDHLNDYFGMIYSSSSRPVAKRAPSDVSRYLAAEIRRHISNGLRQRKGDFPCYFVSEFVTFSLPAEILDLNPVIRERLFDEILDRDVQKELEEESSIINWSLELTESRLYALWNRSTGDCLLDSVLQATWGVFDRENILRKALGDSLHDATSALFPRFKETETLQSNLLHYTIDDEQLQEDWAVILSLATQPGQSLEQIHIFTLAHILRRPIIVYAIKIVKSFRGETLGYADYEGIYLPLLWEPSFCWKSPIALGYTRGHFSALVPIEPDNSDAHIGAGANIRSTDDSEVVYLPLVTSENQMLRLHFVGHAERGREQELIRQWMDCCLVGGILVAKQKIPKKPLLVAQMMEEWLEFYRNLPTTIQHNVNNNEVQDFSSDADSDQE